MKTQPLPGYENAQIRTMNGLVPLVDIEPVDTKQQIYKGTIVKDTEQRASMGSVIFFSRKYDKDNDLDRCLCEYEMPATLIGFAFTLVPKEKCMVLYEPPSTIIKPSPEIFQKGNRLIPRRQ